MFIHVKWWSDPPQSASFRVQATFPIFSTDRIPWNHHSLLISITRSKSESGFYPEWGWLWSIRSSLQIDEHSQFVQLTFSKSFIWSGGTLELTFHMSICGFSAYMQFFRICGYSHIHIHYADFSMRFHADMRIHGCGFPHMHIYFRHAHNPHIDICGLCIWSVYVSAYTNKSKHLYFKTDCVVSDHHLTWMNTHNLCN